MLKVLSYSLFTILLFSLENQAQAQVSDSLKQEIQFKPFEVVIKQLETRYNINFFYNPALLEGSEIEAKIAELPLSEAIAILKNITQMSIVRMSEHYYVFVSNSDNLNDAETETVKNTVVGDMLNYGSKNKITIHGKTVDANNNQALQGVVISFPRLSKNITSDLAGKFTVVLPVGDNEMKATYPGFQDNYRTLKVLSDGDLLVEMFNKVVNIDEIVVSANKIDQNFRRTQMSVQKFTAKNIKELPTMLGETDIIKSLSLLPGIQTTGEFGSGFNVRGGASDQNLILLEDVPVFNSTHLFGLTSIINSDAVSSVTLYKGGIPASYGERASSILNISMGSEELKKTQVKGGISLINSRLNVEIPVGSKLSVMFGGRTTYSDWMLRSIPDKDLMNSSAGFSDYYGRLSYSPNQKNKISLFVYKSNDKLSFGGLQSYGYSNLIGSLKFSHHFSNDLFSNIVVGLSNYKANYREIDSSKLRDAYAVNNSLVYKCIKASIIWEINEKHVLTAGVNAFLYNISPGTQTPYGSVSEKPVISMQDEQGLESALFLSDDIKLSEKLSLEIGIRYSSFYTLGPKTVWMYDPQQASSTESITDSSIYGKTKVIKKFGGLEPRVSLRYNISATSSLRLSYNRINQYINLISNTSIQSTSSIWKISDGNISPVISDQFAIGFFKDFKNGDYETSIELYYKTYQNLIDYRNGASVVLDPKIETELINTSGKNFGAEVFLKKNKGKLTGWISYTYSRALRQTDAKFVSEQINHNKPYPDNLDRPHNLVVNAGFYLNRRVRLGLTYSYNTGRPITLPENKYKTLDGYQVVYYSDRNKYRMPDYHRVDISISRYENLRLKKSWKGFWTFAVINVLGRKNAYSIFYQQDTNPVSFTSGYYNLYKLYIIGIPIPTLTYNIMF